jgi:probable rRNA maturation factor
MEKVKMEVLIKNNQKKKKIEIDKVRTVAQDILNALGSRDVQLSILICDDSEISVLNRKYLGRTGPTNVISFPMQEGEFPDVFPELLGDVVISAETADREAREIEQDFEMRFIELLVHGILHLKGYDHEKDETQALEMEKKSRELMDLFS